MIIDSDTGNQPFSDFDSRMMRRALELARHGELFASPNPMVGAVITVGNRIIGEGYHRVCGQAHAEVNAVAAARNCDFSEATIYVTLEPCSHFGKTPPCALLLRDCGFRRVVVATTDPNPRVSGRGIAILREAGIRVDIGLCAEEALWLNRRFFKAQTEGRPYITLKWAESADGFLDRRRSAEYPGAARISTALTRLEVMRLRAVNDAILVGSATVVADDPSLRVAGIAGRQPVRVTIDRSHTIPASARIFADDSVKVVYFTTRRRDDLPSHVVQVVAESISPADVVRKLLVDFGCISLLVEGGRRIHESFIEAGLCDELRIERGPDSFGAEGVVPAITEQRIITRFRPR